MQRIHRTLLWAPLTALLALGWTGCASTPAAEGTGSTGAAAAGAPSASTDGYYTLEQAEAGAAVWEASCAECHERIDVRGRNFRAEWEGSSVGRLFRTVSRTMPENNPGSLSGEAYLAVVAYILQLNDLPGGGTPLSDDEALLEALRIEL